MKPILTIGIPSRLGMNGYKKVTEQLAKPKSKKRKALVDLQEDYHIVAYLLQESNEWKYQALNGDEEDLPKVKELMEKLEKP